MSFDLYRWSNLVAMVINAYSKDVPTYVCMYNSKDEAISIERAHGQQTRRVTNKHLSVLSLKRKRYIAGCSGYH